MALLCLGLSHRTAPVALRERLAFGDRTLRAALARAGCGREEGLLPVSELAILSTCNRLELYAQAPALPPEPPWDALAGFLAETLSTDTRELAPVLYRHRDLDAARHLCRVAAGLDSMVLGESEVLGQVAEAHKLALSQGASGPVLTALFRTAIRAGRRARAETAIGRNPASVSSVAVGHAREILGDLTGRVVLVVGAGRMGAKTVSALRARGAGDVIVVNRTQERAAELAEEWNGEALGFEHLAAALARADLVIASTGAPHAVIGEEVVRDALRGRPDRPLLLIDIAVPRDVAPGVRDVPGAHVLDLDDLQARIASSVEERAGEVPGVEAVVAEELETFRQWMDGIALAPLVSELRQRAEDIRARELDRALAELPELNGVARERIEHLSRALVNKLLHEPTVRLRAEAGNGHAVEMARAARRLFGLTRAPSDLD